MLCDRRFSAAEVRWLLRFTNNHGGTLQSCISDKLLSPPLFRCRGAYALRTKKGH